MLSEAQATVLITDYALGNSVVLRYTVNGHAKTARTSLEGSRGALEQTLHRCSLSDSERVDYDIRVAELEVEALTRELAIKEAEQAAWEAVEAEKAAAAREAAATEREKRERAAREAAELEALRLAEMEAARQERIRALKRQRERREKPRNWPLYRRPKSWQDSASDNTDNCNSAMLRRSNKKSPETGGFHPATTMPRSIARCVSGKGLTEPFWIRLLNRARKDHRL